MPIRLSHAKDVIGLLEAGYYTHVPIAYTNIKTSEIGGTEIVNVKGRNIGSVYKSQATFEIDFRGLVPVNMAVGAELQAQNTHQILTIVVGQSIPVSMVVATINTSDPLVRDNTDVNDLFRPRPHQSEETSNTDVLYIASGYLDEINIVADAGDYMEVRGLLKADEVYVGGSRTSWLDWGIVGRETNKVWSYLS